MPKPIVEAIRVQRPEGSDLVLITPGLLIEAREVPVIWECLLYLEEDAAMRSALKLFDLSEVDFIGTDGQELFRDYAERLAERGENLYLRLPTDWPQDELPLLPDDVITAPNVVVFHTLGRVIDHFGLEMDDPYALDGSE